MRKLVFFTTALCGLLFSQTTNAQNQSQVVTKGFIIGIENGQVYLDYTTKDIKVGNRVKVYADPVIFIHPVTKNKITKDGELLSTLEITEAAKEYSVAGKIYPSNSIAKLKVGQKAVLSTDTAKIQLPKDGKLNVAITNATVNDAVGIGYFGTYVADLLMEELISCDKIRLIDRSLLNSQIGETDLASAGYINQESSALKGRIEGVQYMIQVTMQRPDVTNITTGIPLKSILTVAGAIAGAVSGTSAITNGLQTSGALSSNIRTARLKASVSISARIVDVQTGEVLFMCNGTGISQGDSQLALEEGALGGLQVNGGVEGFRQTVTGKAIASAYRKIGNDLKDYFNGNTTDKVKKRGLLDTEMTYRKGSIYMGVNKLSSSDIKEAFSETPELYFNYKKGATQQGWSYVLMGVGIPSTALFLTVLLGELGGSAFIPLALAGAGMTLGGKLLYESGKKKKLSCIEVYNDNLHGKKTSEISPQWNLGFTQNGLALRVCF